MKPRTEPIGFRADEQLLKEIDADRGDVSRGVWARQVIIAHLRTKSQFERIATFAKTLESIQDKVDQVGENLRKHLFYMLTLLCSTPEDEARDFVNSKLPKSKE